MKKTRPTMSCPHCEGEDLETFAGEYAPGDDFWYVACLECGAEGPHGDTEEDACKLWDAKHARHRIGKVFGAPAHARAAQDVAQNAAAPLLSVPKPPDPIQAAVMSAAMASTKAPAELLDEEVAERARKRPFFALATGLLKPGA